MTDPMPTILGILSTPPRHLVHVTHMSNGFVASCVFCGDIIGPVSASVVDEWIAEHEARA